MVEHSLITLILLDICLDGWVRVVLGLGYMGCSGARSRLLMVVGLRGPRVEVKWILNLIIWFT